MSAVAVMKGELVVINGWVAEYVAKHTCGTGEGGHYGIHEPGCGLVPIAPVASLRPLRAWVRKARAVWVWGVRDPDGWVQVGSFGVNVREPLVVGSAGSLVEAHDQAARAVLRLMVERST